MFISLVLLVVVLPVSFFAVQYPPAYWRKLAHRRRLGLVRPAAAVPTAPVPSRARGRRICRSRAAAPRRCSLGVAGRGVGWWRVRTAG